jgi:poly-beta-1,6-N-acetyl-D-glucosamine biosynthesis protein PgaD
MSKNKKMKSNNLIIDLRRKLPWHKRYATTTSTAMMWACWLFLWRPIMLIIGLIGLQKPHLVHEVLHAFGVGVQHGITALLACAVALLLWSHFIPSKSVIQPKRKDTQDYADYFEIPVEQIEQGRSQKISTVHHDEHGRITFVE